MKISIEAGFNQQKAHCVLQCIRSLIVEGSWPFSQLPYNSHITHNKLEMGPDPTRAYFWPTVYKSSTHLWPGYFLTRLEAIFSFEGQKIGKFGTFWGNLFPKLNSVIIVIFNFKLEKAHKMNSWNTRCKRKNSGETW